MPTTAAKSEMLASWVYRHGELARQRLAEKTAAIAFVAGLVLFLFIAFPLVFWDTVIFKKTAAWVIVVTFLLFMAAVFYTLRFFSGMLFSIVNKFTPFKEEEVIITSAKIITEKRTWILNDEKKELFSVEWNNAAKQHEIVFRGKGKQPGEANRTYVVRLPVPPDEYPGGEKIYNYFKQLLSTEAVQPQNINV